MKCNILIVDDSPILRMAIKKVAKIAGLDEDHIFEAGNGKEAIQLMESTWIDLVLLDLNMPVMDGEQFAVEIRNHPELNDVAIVVVSTETNKERLDHMRSLGVVDTMHKPFEPEDLRRLINCQFGAMQ